jgi:hypothetical protein
LEAEKQAAVKIKEYIGKVEFLCRSLWPEHDIRVEAHVDQLRMQLVVGLTLQPSFHYKQEPVSFRFQADDVYRGNRFNQPVPREVIAQINMVTG